MIYSNKIRKAFLISYHAHKDDYDKAGYPYVFHPFFVASQMDDEDSTIVALLHDVIENHGNKYDFDYLMKEGMGEKICYAIDLLTYKKDVPYLDYIKKIKDNPLARKVKIADLKHNCNLQRLDGQTHPKYKLYQEALAYLESE
ncbi:MAG TPA: GTP pyrophosphokinase [Bacilli bacterium]|nr:MAG: GTP pyrophosphokinase [Tenericutes bacterium ADurb.BinA124]HNZ50676.1 GTP pyrophosphokinase [Bacilli bacterium]HPX84299.1 GTP pyrophosphokinase [Bacilli bacterium]HQC74330.1 GTP pyrophosphokinase [Bacilli bacterium]